MEELQQTQNRAVSTGGFKGAIREIFGQFLTVEFYKWLARGLAEAAFETFLLTLGGTLVSYGRQRQNKQTNPVLVAARSELASSSNAGTGSKAFGGFSSNPGYQPGTAFPVPASQGDARFPGFGR